jgi:hypothetical protein
MVVKDFSASDGAGATVDFGASGWVVAVSPAKAVAATSTNRMESAIRVFIFCLLENSFSSLLR